MASGDISRPSPRQLTLVSAAFFVSSGLGLLLLVLVARWLSPTENARFLAVWGLLFAFGSILAAVEQEIARQAATAAIHARRVPLAAAQTVAVSAVVSALVLALLLATPPGRTLVASSTIVTALAFASLFGIAAQTLTRGVLLGRHEITRYAVVVVAEPIIRLFVLGALVVAGFQASVPYAVLVTALGWLGWVVVVRQLLPTLEWQGRPREWRHVGATVVALGTANGLSALILTGFPAMATLVIGHPDQLAVLFTVVVFARAPLVLLAPLQTMMVPTAVGWIHRGESDRLDRALTLFVVGAFVAAMLGAGASLVVGPPVIEFVFGPNYRPAASLVALVVAATSVLAAAFLQAAVLIALQRRWQLTACWTMAIGAAGLLMTLSPGDAEQRGVWGLVGASGVAFVATAVAVRQAPILASGDLDLSQ